MKLECPKDKLRFAMAVAEKVTGKNLSLPVLGHVSLEAKERSLKISATNLDVGLEIEIPAKVEQAGAVMVSGAVLANFLGNLLKEEKVRLELIGDNLTVSSARHASLMKTYPRDDFPTLPHLETAANLTLPTATFLNSLKMVAYAASLSDIKPEIASVYLYERDGELYLVATDSFRLAEKRLVLEEPLTAKPKLIIPVRNITEILRVFESGTGELVLNYNQHQLALASDGIYLTSRLVEGVYPDYRQIVPTETKTNVVVLKAELQNALKLSGVFSDRLNQVNLRVAVKDGLLEVNSRNSEVGESTARLDATLQGEDLEVSFNMRYLLDCLAVLPGDSVSLKANGRGRPIVVSGIGDNSFLYLIMPLNR